MNLTFDVTADKCEACGNLTLGLSGPGKWCTYCGAKLNGDIAIGHVTSTISLPSRCEELNGTGLRTNYAVWWNDCLEAQTNELKKLART
jgi:hypothetical protein